jgi:hypothetical protein
MSYEGDDSVRRLGFGFGVAPLLLYHLQYSSLQYSTVHTVQYILLQYSTVYKRYRIDPCHHVIVRSTSTPVDSTGTWYTIEIFRLLVRLQTPHRSLTGGSQYSAVQCSESELQIIQPYIIRSITSRSLCRNPNPNTSPPSPFNLEHIFHSADKESSPVQIRHEIFDCALLMVQS